MMSFFPQSFCAPAANTSFVPLFRLLEDFDNYSREVQSTPAASAPAHRQRRTRQHRPQLSTFNPRFDVRETEHTYELHGELPGLERENVNIEFTEPQTIVIRGRVERSYGPDANKTATEEPAAESTSTTTTTETTEQPTPAEKRRNSHQATVEDDPEDEFTPASSRTASPTTEVAKPVVTQEEQAVAKPAPAPAPTQPQDQSRYWRWERSVGEFSRTFSFPARVDHDGVTASLSNGVLSVTVPKAKKVAARRIEIGF